MWEFKLSAMLCGFSGRRWLVCESSNCLLCCVVPQTDGGRSIESVLRQGLRALLDPTARRFPAAAALGDPPPPQLDQAARRFPPAAALGDPPQPQLDQAARRFPSASPLADPLDRVVAHQPPPRHAQVITAPPARSSNPCVPVLPGRAAFKPRPVPPPPVGSSVLPAACGRLPASADVGSKFESLTASADVGSEFESLTASADVGSEFESPTASAQAGSEFEHVVAVRVDAGSEFKRLAPSVGVGSSAAAPSEFDHPAAFDQVGEASTTLERGVDLLGATQTSEEPEMASLVGCFIVT